MNIYEPWALPFKYEPGGQYIADAKGNMVLDVRGWGQLTGKGSEALGMNEDAAAKLQDELGERVTVLMNQDATKPKTPEA